MQLFPTALEHVCDWLLQAPAIVTIKIGYTWNCKLSRHVLQQVAFCLSYRSETRIPSLKQVILRTHIIVPVLSLFLTLLRDSEPIQQQKTGENH